MGWALDFWAALSSLDAACSLSSIGVKKASIAFWVRFAFERSEALRTESTSNGALRIELSSSSCSCVFSASSEEDKERYSSFVRNFPKTTLSSKAFCESFVSACFKVLL